MPTILVVDDEPMIRTIFRRLLANRYRALIAEDMAGALDILRAEDVDLVLTDINMPGGSGIDLAAAVHERWPQLPIAFMTGNIDERTHARVEELGAPLFTKPFNVDEMLTLLELMLPDSSGASAQPELLAPSQERASA